MFFRIKRNTQLKKLMNAYCDRQSVEMNSIAFLFDGRRLRAEQTPDEVLFIHLSICVSADVNVQCLNSDPVLVVVAVGDGRWGRDRCNATPNWRCSCLVNDSGRLFSSS